MSDSNQQERREAVATDFETMLTKALRPVNAPETLAKFLAIAAEAQAQQRRTGRRWFRPRFGLLYVTPQWLLRPQAWVGGALAAAIVLGVLVGEQVHRRHEQAVAEQEFATSMRITNETLERTRVQLLQAGIQLDQ